MHFASPRNDAKSRPRTYPPVSKRTRPRVSGRWVYGVEFDAILRVALRFGDFGFNEGGKRLLRESCRIRSRSLCRLPAIDCAECSARKFPLVGSLWTG